MKFTLEIECGNAAFGESAEARGLEIARILLWAADRVEHTVYAHNHGHVLQDMHGNAVGHFAFSEESDE